MNNCVCCHNRLLRHLNHSRVYWFCPTCHQEMPNVDALSSASRINRQKIEPKSGLNSKIK